MKLYKLKAGEEVTLRKWAQELTSKFQEAAIKSLDYEHCSREVMVIFELNNEFYLIGHMEGVDFQEPNNSGVNLNHKKVLRGCIEKEVEIEELYDLRINE